MHKHQVQWYGPHLLELYGGAGGGSGKDRVAPVLGLQCWKLKAESVEVHVPFKLVSKDSCCEWAFYYLGREKGEI